MTEISMLIYDPKIKCPKCDNELLSSDYIAILDIINRKCLNCGYTFQQWPKDKAKNSAQKL